MLDLPPLRDVIARHDLQPKKSLGQNFLLDQNITDKIVRLSGDLNDQHVIEIGPGPGGLTRSILNANPLSVTAIETDHRAVKALQELQLVYPDLTIIHDDALAFDIRTAGQGPCTIIANLPYNIATPLLIGWLKIIRDNRAIQSMTLMFQKEVADRITAQPNTKQYGRLSVMAQWLCDVHNVYTLPPSAFTPPPKVNSAVVRFKPKDIQPDTPSFKAMETITAAAFGNRRKMLRSSLKLYRNDMKKCGIDETLRAENISVNDYVRLAYQIETKRAYAVSENCDK